MTESPVSRRCRWCGRPFEVTGGPGRPRHFCKAGCRQADYIARQRGAEVGVSESELIVTRAALDELRDRPYVLETAVEDVERDLADATGEQDLRDALTWLLAAARPLCHPANLT
ncbi:MAG: hypothetical protein ACT452_09885 [Microthrixaceae bacterium]